MTPGDCISVFGMAIEGAGVLLAITGGVRTWREFTDEGIIRDLEAVENLRLRARGALGRAGTLLRRLRGYPPNVIVGTSHGWSQARATLSGEGHVGYAPLNPALDTASALTVLDQRIRAVETMVTVEASRRVQEDNALRTQLHELGTRVDRSVDELGQKDQRIAIGGLRTALVGLGFVLVGLVVQGIGVVVS